MKIDVYAILKVGAPIMGMLSAGIGIYKGLSNEAPAIEVGEMAIKDNRDVTLTNIMRAGGGAVVAPKDVVSDPEVQMTSVAYILIWRKNNRDDCLLVDRNVTLSSSFGESVPVIHTTGALPQGAVGQNLDVVKVTVPDNIAPGSYSILSTETYRCGDANQTYKFPAKPIAVSVGY